LIALRQHSIDSDDGIISGEVPAGGADDNDPGQVSTVPKKRTGYKAVNAALEISFHFFLLKESNGVHTRQNLLVK
jgi:hypothetical protein